MDDFFLGSLIQLRKYLSQNGTGFGSILCGKQGQEFLYGSFKLLFDLQVPEVSFFILAVTL